MFLLYAEKNQLAVREKEPITSGSANTYRVQFEFSPDWDGLTRTACFRSGGQTISVLLDETGRCVIPWEVTRPGDSGKRLVHLRDGPAHNLGGLRRDSAGGIGRERRQAAHARAAGDGHTEQGRRPLSGRAGPAPAVRRPGAGGDYPSRRPQQRAGRHRGRRIPDAQRRFYPLDRGRGPESGPLFFVSKATVPAPRPAHRPRSGGRRGRPGPAPRRQRSCRQGYQRTGTSPPDSGCPAPEEKRRRQPLGW